MGFVVRIDNPKAGMYGHQAKIHHWAGICMKKTCRCHKKASRFFADKRWGGKRESKRLATEWLEGSS